MDLFKHLHVKIVSLCVGVILWCAMGAGAYAEDVYIDDLAYSLDEISRTATVINWSADISSDVEIPSTISRKGIEYRVTMIGEDAFSSCHSIQSVTIPNGVTKIENWAFYGCSLQRIDIPNSVTVIEEDAFAFCSRLQDITIPSGVTEIGNGAFVTCDSLKNVTSLNPVPPILGSDVFSDHNIRTIYVPSEAISAYKTADGWNDFNIEDVAYKDAVFSFNVDGIDYYITSFAEKTVEVISTFEITSWGNNQYSEDIVIPESVTYNDTVYSVTAIGNYAFEECHSLQSIKIPNSVTKIGNSAFYKCGLDSITIPNSVTAIGNNAFASCNLQSIKIPNSVTKIGNSAFYDCGLDSITIPNSVTAIGNNAFAKCYSLQSITIPNSVTAIGNNAFEECSSLQSITIPNSVTEIGDYAFRYCKRLKKVTSLNTLPPMLGSEVFLYSHTNTVFVPSIAISTYKVADRWKDYNIKSVAVKDALTEFAVDGIYYNITSITHKTVEVTSVDDHRYSDDIVIPEAVTYNDTVYSVTAIGNSAFYGSSGIRSIEIPNSVTKIGNSAFLGTAIPNITIPNSVTEIGSYAFANCSMFSFKNIEIPNSVTTIGNSAFAGCDGLTSITIPNSVTTMGSSAFKGCTYLQNITISNSVTTIGNSTFEDCFRLQNITIPNSVTEIGESAFEDCSQLRSVIIPNGVTEIGKHAFSGCDSIKKVISLNSVPPTLGSDVFEGDPIKFVFVLLEAIPVYKNTDGWNKYRIDDVAYKDANAYFNVDGIYYFVTSFADKSIEVTSGNNEYSGDIVLPETVNYNDTEFFVTKIGDYAFELSDSLKSVAISNSVTEIGKNAFYSCDSITSITIPNGVTAIREYTFYHCYNLKSVTIPNSVTEIGKCAFQGCQSLQSIAIPNSVTGIRKYAFYGCYSLKSINIPSCVTEIEDYVFDCCDSLQNITIPNKITSIGYSAFSSCYSLKNITIPSSVISIGRNAFSGCSNLSCITSTSEALSLEKNAFARVTATAYVPAASAALYNSLDWGTGNRGKITIEYLNDYKRTTQARAFGTLCLPYDYTPEGATLYGIESIKDNQVVLTAVEGNHGLANTTYIYQATEAEQNSPMCRART